MSSGPDASMVDAPAVSADERGRSVSPAPSSGSDHDEDDRGPRRRVRLRSGPLASPPADHPAPSDAVGGSAAASVNDEPMTPVPVGNTIRAAGLVISSTDSQDHLTLAANALTQALFTEALKAPNVAPDTLITLAKTLLAQPVSAPMSVPASVSPVSTPARPSALDPYGSALPTSTPLAPNARRLSMDPAVLAAAVRVHTGAASSGPVAPGSPVVGAVPVASISGDPVPSSSPVPVPRLPKRQTEVFYSGSSNRAALDTFEFEARCSLSHYRLDAAPPSDQLRHLQGLLKGAARTWYARHCISAATYARQPSLRPNHFAEIGDVDAFFLALRRQFLFSSSYFAARDRLKALRQGGTSIDSFNDAFNSLTASVPDMTSIELYYAYLQSLNPDYRREAMRGRDLDSLNDSELDVLALQREMAALGAAGGPVRSERSRPPRFNAMSGGGRGSSDGRSSRSHDDGDRRRSSGGRSSYPGAVRRALGALVRGLSVEARAELNETKACYYCRKPEAGHSMNECPRLEKDVESGKFPPSPPGDKGN
eukprot:GILI01000435.1.p1 GENE.GILI01000435.1~~GILI01000435.1.p1  ORF type:complete len:539 (+),score=105.28 GILI01000435.1:155-1771(+)